MPEIRGEEKSATAVHKQQGNGDGYNAKAAMTLGLCHRAKSNQAKSTRHATHHVFNFKVN